MDSVVSKKRYLVKKDSIGCSAYGRIRDVCSGPNGELYFIGGDRSLQPSINVIYNPLFVTGITEFNFKNNINIYPNPTNGVFTIKMNDYEKGKYEVVDYLGNLIIRGELTNKETKIDINPFSNGLYFIKVISKNINTYKIVKTEN